MPIIAHFEDKNIYFDSLTQTANYFNVDRSTISSRLGTSNNINGWTFSQAFLDSNI